jgi:uncharacterized membrane protein
MLWSDFRLLLPGVAVLLPLLILGDIVWFLQPLRLILGLIFVLYVPGYCLTAAIFCKLDDFSPIERLGLSVGLSIATIPLLAALVDRLPWGMRLWPIVLAELTVSVLCALLAVWRRGRIAPEIVFAPEPTLNVPGWWRHLPPPDRRMYALLVGALVLAGLAAGWVLSESSPDEYVTEFYVLGQSGMAEDYPRRAAASQTLTATLGIANHELIDHTYRVEGWVTDTWNPDRRQLVMRDGPIIIAAGDAREWPISWRMPWVGNDQQIEFLLFADEQETPYRRLRLWLDVAEGPGP